MKQYSNSKREKSTSLLKNLPVSLCQFYMWPLQYVGDVFSYSKKGSSSFIEISIKRKFQLKFYESPTLNIGRIKFTCEHILYSVAYCCMFYRGDVVCIDVLYGGVLYTRRFECAPTENQQGGTPISNFLCLLFQFSCILMNFLFAEKEGNNCIK
jgi:hypothetical protein